MEVYERRIWTRIVYDELAILLSTCKADKYHMSQLPKYVLRRP